MKDVICESSGLEPILRSFVDASNTKYYKGALDLLFLNGSAFEVFENSGICSLISLRESEEDVYKSIDLIEGKFKTNITPFLNEVFKALLPGLLMAFKKTGIYSDEKLGEQEIQTRMVTAFMTTVPELQKKIKALTGLFVNGAFLFSDIVLVAIYKGFMEIRGSHLRTGVAPNDYEKMIAHLVKLDIVRPRMRVSICPICMNTELVVSRHPSMNDACPKCGTSWSSAILFLFEEQFGKIKSSNNDLPLFISTYLKHQIGLNAFGEKIEILPNAVVSTTGKQVEIDVFIPQYKIGIECKNYLTSSMPDTSTRIEGLAGQFRAQLMNYKQAGIEQVFIVANLPNRTYNLLKKKLSEDTTKNTDLPKAVIIQGNTNSLLEFLKGLSSTLVNNANRKLEAGFQKQLQENLKAETEGKE